MKPARPHLAILIPVVAIMPSCKKDNKETTTQATGYTSGQSTTEVNALAAAYPGTLALSMFPTGEAALRLDDEPTPAQAGLDASYSEKLNEADRRMRGEGDCFKPAQLQDRLEKSRVTCYEFDSDMEPFEAQGRAFGTQDGTDGAGQACMVSFAKEQVETVTAQVDRALAVVQGLLCEAKKDAVAKGTAVPEVKADAEGLKLAELVNQRIGAKLPFTFDKADLSAVTNADGSVTYITAIDIKRTREGKVDSIILRHTPESGSVEENGMLTFVRQPSGPANLLLGSTPPPSGGAADPNLGSEKFGVMNITYQRSVDADGMAHMKAELNQARIHKDYAPLDDTGMVNFKTLPNDAQNAQIHAIKSVSFDVDPATGAGNLSYWMNPGGRKDESARGFLFHITADDTGLLSGCGISGSTQNISIRAAALDPSKTLTPVMYWHPFANGNTSMHKDERYTGSTGNKITQQCFKQNNGLYVIDTAKTLDHRGYDVLEGSATSVKPPERPPVPANLPPPPPVAATKPE
jgi:hypothetical protein